jgi:hypothetical protein
MQLNQLSLPRLRADFSFQSMKTTILIDLNSLAIKDIHYTQEGKGWLQRNAGFPRSGGKSYVY